MTRYYSAIRFIGGCYPNTASVTSPVLRTPQHLPAVCQPHIIHSLHVAFPQRIGGPQSGAISISATGHIDGIYPSMSLSEAKQLSTRSNRLLKSFGDDVALSPGLVDVHCHISELGRDWEGYHTATRAAAAGGITTLMGMPLNSLPPTTTVDALQQEIDASRKVKLMSDVGLWGGAVPTNTSCDNGMHELQQLLDAGVFGLKAFLAPLPSDAGYATVSPGQLSNAASICGARKKPLLVHSELMTQQQQDSLADEAHNCKGEGSYEAHVESRPGKWEQDAVKVVCELTDRCHMHIVHLSDAGCLDLIQTTKEKLRMDKIEGKKLTVETTPHNLLFELESLPGGDTRYKCFPPIRDRANRLQLWLKGLCGVDQNSDPLIDMIASDHSPCTPDMRLTSTGNVRKAWGGLSGLQYQLQGTLTALDQVFKNNSNRQMLAQISQWWSTSPSQLVPGLSSLKGSIDIGYQADLCAYDMTFIGEPNSYSKEYHKWKGTSVYPELKLKGRVIGTWLRGIKIYNGESDQLLQEDNGVGSMMLHKQ